MANIDPIYDIIEKVGHMYIQEKEISYMYREESSSIYCLQER